MLFISSDLPWLYPYQARIRLHLPVHAAAERLPPTAGHLQADGENACILHTGAESPDVLAIYVAILGTDFEILDPPELAEHILALAGQAYPCSTPLSRPRCTTAPPGPGQQDQPSGFPLVGYEGKPTGGNLRIATRCGTPTNVSHTPRAT